MTQGPSPRTPPFHIYQTTAGKNKGTIQTTEQHVESGMLVVLLDASS